MKKRIAKKIVSNHSLGRCNYSSGQKKKAYKLNAKYATPREIAKTAHNYARTLLKNAEVRIYLHEEENETGQDNPPSVEAGSSDAAQLPDSQEG